MKLLLVAIFAALVSITQASPIESQDVEIPELAADAMEPMEMLNGARQRICTAALCQSVCRSLGWRTGSCNAQLLCICRR
ncbi:unnamed protein product [Pieris macdunnoughi]|uniref:Defensin n=1 Tax=Pieris macdunnoughi TaxID=345717 RepID=A0A821USJ8_9NEOP|nr:unnamed protein product [Pieris macdunnoughi]